MTQHTASNERMNRMHLTRRLLDVARPVLPPLVISMICRLAALLVGIALFGLGGWVLATRASGEPTWTLTTLVVVLVILSLAKGILRYLEQFSGHWVAFRSLALLRNYFYDRLEPQAPSRTIGQDSGDVLSRVTKDVDRIEVFFAHTLAPGTTAILAPVIVVSYLGVAVSPVAALTLIPFLILVGAVVPRVGARSSDRAARDLRRLRGELSHHVTDSVQGVREVVAFGYEKKRLREMAECELGIASGIRTTWNAIAARRGLNQALLGAAVITMLAVLSHQYYEGAVSVGQIGLALGVALASFAPVLAVEDFAADLDQAYASAQRVFEITDRDSLVLDPENPVSCDGKGDITLENVSFAYPSARSDARRPTVLHDLSFTAPAGKVTAIVGASGSGKSTVAALVDRMWDVDGGRVALGGVNVRDITQEQLHELVAYAPQRPYLFNDTVRANLLMARPDASDDELLRVCEQVGLSQWLETEPDGLDTRVGEMGERLSGGQRQRVALGRALLRRSPVIILDEATSQLDTVTEAHVLDGIRRATEGSTLLVIAHRISTVRDADQILVMDRGRLVASGTYDDLMARGGALATLVAREALGEGENDPSAS